MNYLKLNIGYVDEDGEILPLNTDPDETANGHIALIGSSGGGKSVQAQRIMSDIVENGGTVVAISEHGSFAEDQIFEYYKPVIQKYRNNIYAYDNGIPAHLFTPLNFSDGTEEKAIDTVGSITDIVSRAMGFGVKQKEILRKATDIVMKSGKYQVDGFKAIGEALGKGSTSKGENEIYLRMQNLFEHNVFVDGDNLIVPNKINIVHLDKLDLSTQDVARELLLSHIWRLGNADQFKGDNEIYLFIDECQNAASNSKGPLALMLSEGRRMGINLILATQMILEGTTKAVQQRISQCGLLLYFKPASNRMSITAKSIDPADASAWAIVLRHLKIGEFVAVGNFLLAGNRVGYPIKATANVKKIADIDEKYDFFGKSAGESEDKSVSTSKEYDTSKKCDIPEKIGNGFKTSGGYYMP